MEATRFNRSPRWALCVQVGSLILPRIINPALAFLQRTGHVTHPVSRVLLHFEPLGPTSLLELIVELIDRSGRLCCAVGQSPDFLKPSTRTFLLRLWYWGVKPVLAIRRSTRYRLLGNGPFEVFAFWIQFPVDRSQPDRFLVRNPV